MSDKNGGTVPVSTGQPEKQGDNPLSQLTPAEADYVGKAADILRPLLKNPSEAPKAAAAIVASVEMFSGPLPHPEHLERYETLAPGIARDIFDMTAKEQMHRHAMQRLEMRYPYFGWFSGTVGFLACIGAAVYLAILGNRDALAAGVLGVPVVGVVGWFINARISQTFQPPSEVETSQRAAGSGTESKRAR